MTGIPDLIANQQNNGYVERREDSDRSNYKHGVDGVEDAHESASQLVQSKEQLSKQPKRKIPILEFVQHAARSQNGHPNEDSRSLIPDINCTELPYMSYQVKHASQENGTNPAASTQETHLGCHYSLPDSQINNILSVPTVNSAAQNMFVDCQPLLYTGFGNVELHSGTSFGPLRPFSLLAEYGPPRDKQQLTAPIFEKQIRFEDPGVFVGNHVYGRSLALNGGSSAIAENMHLLVEEPFQNELDKFVVSQFDNSLEELSFNFPGLNSPCPDIDDFFVDDESLMEYLGHK